MPPSCCEFGDEAFKHLAFMIHGTPKVVHFVFQSTEYFEPMPLPVRILRVAKRALAARLTFRLAKWRTKEAC
jgi:uncharacterized membrane protein YphA (DoxX/SURF4 family)